ALEGLYVPVQAPWYPAFRAELLSFPAGKHDDQVDALGLIGQLLDKMTACRPPKQDPDLKRDDYCELHEQIGDDVLTLWARSTPQFPHYIADRLTAAGRPAILLPLHATALTLSKGRLIRCTVPGSTPNRCAILRTPSVRPGALRAAKIRASSSGAIRGRPS